MAAKRVTNEDILKINQIYAEVGTYAETARQTGFSASTVKKYINPNFSLVEQTPEKIEFNHMNPPDYPKTGFEWRELMLLSPEEIEQITELRKEVLI